MKRTGSMLKPSLVNADINGLGVLIDRSASANILYRMRALAIDELDPSANTWTDRTGTALTGADTDRPQFQMHKGVLCFTNEGSDRPRRITATGTNSVVLGGTPPFCRSISALFNYLILGNISDDGTSTALIVAWLTDPSLNNRILALNTLPKIG